MGHDPASHRHGATCHLNTERGRAGSGCWAPTRASGGLRGLAPAGRPAAAARVSQPFTACKASSHIASLLRATTGSDTQTAAIVPRTQRETGLWVVSDSPTLRRLLGAGARTESLTLISDVFSALSSMGTCRVTGHSQM